MAEDSLFIATVLMQYSVSNYNKALLCVKLYSCIANVPNHKQSAILHCRATQMVQITAKAFTICSRYLVQNKYSHYKPIQNNNMHTSYQINYIKLKVRHQTSAPLSPTCRPLFKAQTVHQLLQRHNSTLRILEVKHNSYAHHH